MLKNPQIFNEKQKTNKIIQIGIPAKYKKNNKEFITKNGIMQWILTAMYRRKRMRNSHKKKIEIQIFSTRFSCITFHSFYFFVSIHLFRWHLSAICFYDISFLLYINQYKSSQYNIRMHFFFLPCSFKCAHESTSPKTTSFISISIKKKSLQFFSV